jgi:hypothetical protein
MKVIGALLCLALVAASPAFAARGSVPMQEFIDLPINASGKPSNEQIRKAIIQGAASYNFVASAPSGNKVKLTYSKREHALVVEVVFTPKSYSINYVDSVNLGYSMEGGKPVIHPTANRWLLNLRQRIDRQLIQL